MCRTFKLSLILIALFLVFSLFISPHPASAETLSVGENKTFTTCNWHQSEEKASLVGLDPYFYYSRKLNVDPSQWTDVQASSVGNSISVMAKTLPPPETIQEDPPQNPNSLITVIYAYSKSYANAAIEFELDLNGYSWDEVYDWPIRITTAFAYQFEVNSAGAYSAETYGTIANASFWIEVRNGHLEAYREIDSWFEEPNSNSFSGTAQSIQLRTLDGMKGYLDWASVEVRALSYPIESGGGIQSSSAQITIESVKVEFLEPPASIDLKKRTDKSKTVAVGEPINVANGNMYTSEKDISIPSGQLPLELSRTYNSQDDYYGLFGYGWRTNLEITLKEYEDGSVLEVDEQGTYTKYTKNADGSYTASEGKLSILSKNADGSYQILRKHGAKLYFNDYGLLTKIEDRNGNTITILRDAGWLIQEVSDSSNRKLLFTANEWGGITQITDPAGRVFKYEYDATGNLTKVTDPLNNETTYSYDAGHNLTQKTDARGNNLYFEYDSSDRAYHSWQDNQNNEVTLVFNPITKTTSVTDSLGNVTAYEYNDYGLVTKITDAQGNQQLFVWDSQLNKTSSTNQNGSTTSFTYDQRGNLLTATDPLANITIFTYEPNFDFVNFKTDSQGNKTEYSYDARGNLIQTKDTLNNITTYSYDASGLLTQTKDANNNITGFSYDSYGNLTNITDSLNNETTFTYDILGNKTQATDAQGNTTSFVYDLLNRLTEVTYPDSSKVTSSYDPAGNPISTTDQNNNATTYSYDVVDRLIQTTDAGGNVTTYSYDTEGNRTAITDAQGNTTTYTYDSLNRLITTQDPLGNQAQFSYDAVGNSTQITDSLGNSTSFTYDALSRRTQETDASNNSTSYQYDSLGNTIGITDAKGNSTTYTYDLLNRLTKTAFPDNTFETYSYDSIGNNTQKTTRKSDTINYSYDSLNRLITKSYPDSSAASYIYDSLSRLASTTSPSGTIAYSYDSLSRVTTVTYPNGKVVSYSYDPAGNRIKLTYPDSSYITYEYDNLNRLTNIKDQVSSTIASYSYDNLSRRTNLSLTNGVTTTYAYDQASRLISLTNAKASTTISSFTYTYDPVGNRLSMATPQGTSSYTYDNTYQLTKTQAPSLPAYTYSYDSLGNRTQTVEYATSTYTTNNLNQYTKTVKGIITTSLTYDNNGNLASTLSGTSSTTTYSYDYDNRLTQAVTSGRLGKTTKYTYDPFGRRLSKEVNGSIKAKYIYDQDQVIAEYDSSNNLLRKYVYGPNLDEPLKGLSLAGSVPEWFYSLDGLGSVSELTNSSGSVVEKYTYDSFGKPAIKNQAGTIYSSSPLGNPYLYTSREYEPETALYHYRARYYSPTLGRFLQADPIGYEGGINLYSYTKNNPVNWVDPFGLDKQKNDKPWWEKLREGYYYGTGFGQQSAEWYAQQQLQTGNPLWAIPGSVASLWTPETYQVTGGTLATPAIVGMAGPVISSGLARIPSATSALIKTTLANPVVKQVAKQILPPLIAAWMRLATMEMPPPPAIWESTKTTITTVIK